MRGPIQQAGHIAYEVGYFLASLFSRVIHAVFYGGSMHQTLSARAHIEARTSTHWQGVQRRINAVFFWQPDHCKRAWDSEVTRARKTLQRNGDL
ncbi:hypothetical protein [Sulfitobacter sp.]|uniref:hypothetical protein n=1 Tax=Sulfitobacter sp. TaxID=1903071 RepID=UPI003F6AA58D